jgi:invasion protein IalB
VTTSILRAIGLQIAAVCAIFFCDATPLYAQYNPGDTLVGQRAVEAEPQSTTATFGDWVMRCNRIPEAGGQTQRVCEVAQTVIIQGQQAPVAEVAIGRIKKADPLRITIVLPVNVTFPSAPRVYSDAKDTEGLELMWKRCLPNGCFADTNPKDEIIRAWRGSRTPGRIETRDAFGRNVVVTISFRGLSQALDALGKEP